jgi:prepilin-type N-terminal cleavage/methylation domain-containing protein
MNPAPRPDKTPKRRGTTLIELLSAMAILSILVLVLATMLGAAFDRFRESAEAVEQRGDARVALGWIERDLAGHVASRHASLPRLPDRCLRAPTRLLRGPSLPALRGESPHRIG